MIRDQIPLKSTVVSVLVKNKNKQKAGWPIFKKAEFFDRFYFLALFFFLRFDSWSIGYVKRLVFEWSWFRIPIDF